MPPTNSSWLSKVSAVFWKEWRVEARARHGLFTSGLFGLLAVVAASVASYGQRPTPDLAAGTLAVTLVFAAVVALPRTFLAEDEQGTFDLLRLVADPSAAFLGKALYSVAQTLAVGVVLAALYVGLTDVEVVRPSLFFGGLLVSSAGVAAGVAACGALAVGASNRWVLASALAMPLLLPQVFMTVGALRAGLGSGSPTAGAQSLVGLAGWAVCLLAGAPVLVGMSWALEPSARPEDFAETQPQSSLESQR